MKYEYYVIWAKRIDGELKTFEKRFDYKRDAVKFDEDLWHYEDTEFIILKKYLK